MPLLHKRPFVRREPPPNLQPTDKVFYCDVTGEVFTQYEEFWERLVLCNSMVWCCELTGRPNLTYLEAAESEGRARRCLANVPQQLRRPMLYVASLTRRGRYADMSEDVFGFVRDRYFVGEEVEAIVKKHWYDCKVTRVIHPTPEEVAKYKEELEESDEEAEEEKKGEDEVQVVKEGKQEDDDEIQVIKEVNVKKAEEEKKKKEEEDDDPPFATFKYEVVEIEPWDYKECKTHIVTWEQIRRNKGVFTREKCKLFMKQCVQLSPSGFWVIKEKPATLYNLTNMTFSDIFPGPAPKFQETRAKKMPLSLNPNGVVEKRRRERKEAREKTEGGGEVKKRGRPPMTEEEREARKKIIKEAKEAKLPKLTEEQKEELRLKVEKERVEKQKEREIRKEEKKIKLQYIKDWNRVREDLDCDDHKDLPEPTPVECSIPDQEFGHFLAVLEFVNIFWELLELKDVYPQGITFEMLESALVEKEVAGVLNDLFQLLLQAIFTLQEGEDDEVKDDASFNLGPETETGDLSMQEAVRVANRVNTWTQHYHGQPLQKVQLDALTLTEVLRLHLLASGATNVANCRWRHFNRGGYKHHDDPGLHFKIEEPTLLKSLAHTTLFDLSVSDKLKLLNLLIGQILTYASLRDIIDDNIEKLREVKNRLRRHQHTQGRHERELNAARLQEKRNRKQKEREKLLKAAEKKEELKQEERGGISVKPPEGEEEEEEEEEGEEEKAAREEKEAKNNEARRQDFRKREAELIQQVLNMGRGVTTAPLGQDRAFRRYWVFSNLAGLFVEDWEPHPGPCRSAPTPHHPDSLAKVTEGQAAAIRAQACRNLAHILDPAPESGDKENAGPVPTRPQAPPHPTGRPLHPTALANGAQAEPKAEEAQLDGKEEVGPRVPPVFGLCTADPESCPVHARSPTRHRWYFFHRPEHVSALLAALNPRGHREHRLQNALTAVQPGLLASLRACPLLCLNPTQLALQEEEGESGLRKSQRHTTTAAASTRKDTHLNFPPGTPVEEVVRLTLTDMVLETEEKLHFGMLGSLTLHNRERWREELVSNTSSLLPDLDYGGRKRMAQLRSELGMDPVEQPKQEEEGGVAPGVKELRQAILQLAQAVDHKYLQPPLGETEKARRSRERAEESYRRKNRKEEDGSSEGDAGEEEEDDKDNRSLSNLLTPLERWEISLMASTSLSQLCLHFATLDNSISWARSAANARCRVCRRKNDPESMLLCDGCNKGTHLHCLKPKLKEVPTGDWFCDQCCPKERPKSPRKKRQIYTEDSDDELTNRYREDQTSEEEEEDQERAEEEEESYVCFVCSSGGTLVYCDKCPLAFHLKCAALRKFPRGPWSCSQCTASSKGKDNAVDKKRSNKEPNKAKATTPKGTSKGTTPKSTPKNTPKGSTTKSTKGTTSRSTPKGSTPKSTPKGSTPKSTPKGTTPKSTPKGTTSKGRKSSLSPVGEKRKKRDESEELPPAKKSKTDNSESPPRRMSGRRSLGVDGDSALNTTVLTTLLDELQRHPDCCHFNKPVSKKLAPDYYEVVRKPMDLGKVRDKLSSLKYSSDEELLADVMLVFQNCQQYNLEETVEYRAGVLLSDLFLSRVSQLGLPMPNNLLSPAGRKRKR